MPNTYFEAAYPAPWQVLGVPLKPFSLGHYIKLHRLGCAFVADEVKPATLGDLLLGVAVCSMESHPDASKDPFWNWLNRIEPEGWFDRVRFKLHRAWMKLWGKPHFTPAELDMIRLGKKCGAFSLGDKVKVFAEYVNEHAKAPAYWEAESKDL